ncbi:MAG: hypothetical protein V7707_20785 [Motiliproteus sp.]
MGCLTKASQYELALYAYEKSVLQLNPWYGEGPGNTRTWREKNNWYHKKPPSLLKPWTWFSNEDNDFLLKSLESRFNFVKAVSTHGTDIMITNAEFYKEVSVKPFSYENLNNLYDVFQYDFAYSKYLDACESGNGAGMSEPIIESYRR